MAWQEYVRQQIARLDNLRDALRATAVWDPPATAATQGAQVTTTVTVPGAAVGDMVVVSHSSMAAGSAVAIDGIVTAANTVTVRLINETAAAVDLASGTLKVLVFK
jgi:spore coat protein U-like protein